MKSKIYKIIMSAMLILMVMSQKSVTNATGQYFDNNKNSVVQVVLYYTAEDSTRYILQSGSGVVINNNTVLTNYHIVHMNDSNMKKAKKLVDKNDLSHDAISMGIVKQDDVLIEASVSQESEEKDFALITLSEPTDRMPAILGTSSAAVTAESVTALGYPTTKPFSKDGAQLYTVSDVNLISGTISEVTADNIKVSGKISAGNSGGALVNASTGEVIGLLIYNKDDAKKECFKVLPIDAIKDPYLAGTTYSDNSVVPTTEEVTTEAQASVTVDKTDLSQMIDSARGLNRDEYTEESYLYMYDEIKDAEHVLEDENATQEEVDRALDSLRDSKQNLTVVEGPNWVLIICIVLLIVAIIAIVVVVIIIVNMKKKEKERDAFKVLPNEELPVYQQSNLGYSIPNQAAATQEQILQSGSQETTVLNMAGMNPSNNATTVLNVAAPERCAFLVRKKNGEKKKIDSIEFTVGQDASRVNYCITDNATISRCHMKIIKKGMQYYVMDLGSTNRTYVNGAVIPPNQEFSLKHGDSIKVSDEELTFEIM